mmetsp:Transcript_37271/g.79162  ORF Transcript_37271/g.79162 Transcript_37271/m.79162 type:complete len:156 (-) Transcript_37271:20-487(-)
MSGASQKYKWKKSNLRNMPSKASVLRAAHLAQMKSANDSWASESSLEACASELRPQDSWGERSAFSFYDSDGTADTARVEVFDFPTEAATPKIKGGRLPLAPPLFRSAVYQRDSKSEPAKTPRYTRGQELKPTTALEISRAVVFGVTSFLAIAFP